MPDSRFKNQCLDIFGGIEEQRKELFALLEPLTDEQLHFSPAAEKWNLLQIADHVMTAEKLSVIYIKRKTGSDRQIQRSGLRAKFRLWILKTAFTSPLKFKAPNATDATGKDPDYEKLKSDWQSVREELKSLIVDLDEDALKGEILKHPRVGMLNMKQALEFMSLHVDHHRKQIVQIMNQPEFPAGE